MDFIWFSESLLLLDLSLSGDSEIYSSQVIGDSLKERVSNDKYLIDIFVHNISLFLIYMCALEFLDAASLEGHLSYSSGTF